MVSPDDAELQRWLLAETERLLADLTRWVNEEIEPYGMTSERVRFVTFVRNARTLRLMQDTATIAGEW